MGLLKEFKPKYRKVIITESKDFFHSEDLGMIEFTEAKRKYGNRLVLAFGDSDETKTTIITIEGE